MHVLYAMHLTASLLSLLATATASSLPPGSVFKISINGHDTSGTTQASVDSSSDPSTPKPVTHKTYKNLEVFSHYAVAAYCASNQDYTADKVLKPLYCEEGGGAPCAIVSASNTSAIYNFQDYGDYAVSGYVGVDHGRKLSILSFAGRVNERPYNASVTVNQEKVDEDKMAPVPGMCEGCEVDPLMLKVWDDVKEQMSAMLNLAVKMYGHVVVTGHSRGGTLGAVAAAWLRRRDVEVSLYTYNSPRAGNEAFAKYISSKGQNHRVTHKLAHKTLEPKGGKQNHTYTHFGPEYYIDTPFRGKYPEVKDIKAIKGPDSEGGNLGDVPRLKEENRGGWEMSQDGDDKDWDYLKEFDAEDHWAADKWAFGQMDKCDRVPDAPVEEKPCRDHQSKTE